VAEYQNRRRDLGRAPKTINSELSVLRQLLKHAKLWYRFLEDYKPLKNTKPGLLRSPETTPQRLGPRRIVCRLSVAVPSGSRPQIDGHRPEHSLLIALLMRPSSTD